MERTVYIAGTRGLGSRTFWQNGCGFSRFLPLYEQLAIRAHHVVRQHHSAGSDKLYQYQKLRPELCLIHRTKQAKRTALGPNFQPVHGILPENMYRDKDDEERKGEEGGGGDDEKEGDKYRETNNEKRQ